MFMSAREHSFLEAVSKLAYSNPFLPERVDFERETLGPKFVAGEPMWSMNVADPSSTRANHYKIGALLETMVAELRERLRRGVKASRRELVLYEDAVIHLLYHRNYAHFYSASFGRARSEHYHWRFYGGFRKDWSHFFSDLVVHFPTQHDPVHTFACFRQIQVAFETIFRDIIGGSMPAARLRASVWQSIFTHDMRRYRRTLYTKMGEFATLITGPSGTGKELAARAIANSRYFPFDERDCLFSNENEQLFFPINISALSPTLVESELFGHRRGSFTGAIADRKGWLESCTPLGSVFLDELGDLDPGVQVKLLRVIETRTFHPVGDSRGRQFHGKLIAATNRDLSAAIRKGVFREDLYYRLCSDLIATPSLAEQLADSPHTLGDLILYMTRRVAGEDGDEFAPAVAEWIERNLGAAYPWPGNYRELEQCVKNVLIRRDYRPASAAANGGDAVGETLDEIRHVKLTAEEVLRRYITLAYAAEGSYDGAAKRIALDRRTVKSKIDRDLLKGLTRTSL
jgi:transcriptional regulator with AAA-type ATPase domain